MSDNLPIIILSPATQKQLEEFRDIYDMHELHARINSMGYRLIVDTDDLSPEDRKKVEDIKRDNIFHEGDMLERFLATLPSLEPLNISEELSEPQSIKGKHYPDGASYHKFRK